MEKSIEQIAFASRHFRSLTTSSAFADDPKFSLDATSWVR
jgi:hypothetical protein